VPGWRVPALTLTDTVPGVAPLVGLTESQLAVVDTVVNAEKVSGTPELLTLMDWAAGAGPPAVWVKLKMAGETVRLPEVTV
jgi:hypothetical protein